MPGWKELGRRVELDGIIIQFMGRRDGEGLSVLVFRHKKMVLFCCICPLRDTTGCDKITNSLYH